METKAKRTLVKSAPELWDLADDLARMESWMSEVSEQGAPVQIEVTRRFPERLLIWQSADPERTLIGVELAESGFGTAVEITAIRKNADRVAADTLERLLDELGSPERRPFSAG